MYLCENDVGLAVTHDRLKPNHHVVDSEEPERKGEERADKSIVGLA